MNPTSTRATPLPPGLCCSRYAPSPPALPPSLPAALVAGGYAAAGFSIAAWQRQGSIYGSSSKSSRAMGDPYQVAAEQLLGQEVRQELFSFTAASLVDLSQEQQLALLNSRDTLVRLHWLSQAVQPFLDQLQAKAAVQAALGGNGRA
ncbi:hypothetical protein QJQ45_016070 [Haematococcus lacustris]|nr:hypothetical protein QJQ45_016070 [Haematococcus lacustris]